MKLPRCPASSVCLLKDCTDIPANVADTDVSIQKSFPKGSSSTITGIQAEDYSKLGAANCIFQRTSGLPSLVCNHNVCLC